MEELLVSDYVWMTKEDGSIFAVVLETNSLTKKTHLNNKTVQYTIEVTKSGNIINKIR
jgi:hypothetical protein